MKKISWKRTIDKIGKVTLAMIIAFTSLSLNTQSISKIKAASPEKTMMFAKEGLSYIKNPLPDNKLEWRGDNLYWGSGGDYMNGALKWQILNKNDTRYTGGSNPGMLIFSYVLENSRVQYTLDDYDYSTRPYDNSYLVKQVDSRFKTQLTPKEQSQTLTSNNSNNQAYRIEYEDYWYTPTSPISEVWDGKFTNKKWFSPPVSLIYNQEYGFSRTSYSNGTKPKNLSKFNPLLGGAYYERRYWLAGSMSKDLNKYISVPAVYAYGGADHAIVYPSAGTNAMYIRVASVIDTKSVLFVSAANGGKQGNGVSSYLAPINAKDSSDWKFTLKDDTQSIKVTDVQRPSDTEALISYEKNGPGNSISVIMTNDAGDEILYYGRIASVDSGYQKGTAKLTVPADLDEKGYKYKVFSEQYNGETHTDYANMPAEIEIPLAYKASFEVRALKDEDTTRTLLSPSENGKYSLFAKEKVDFEINANTIAGVTENLGTAFTPSTPTTTDWKNYTYNDLKNPKILNVVHEGITDRTLYFRANDKVQTVTYKTMIENINPTLHVKAPIVKTMKDGVEQNDTYNKGSPYSKIILPVDVSDTGAFISGIAKVEAVRLDNDTQVPIEVNGTTYNNGYVPSENANGTGPSSISGINVNCFDTGIYKVKITVSDKAGNSVSYTSDELEVDNVVPNLIVEWTNPTGKSKGNTDLDYDFDVWSDQEAIAKLSLTEESAKQQRGTIEYSYRYAETEAELNTKEYIKLQETPLKADATVDVDLHKETALFYDFKVTSRTGVHHTVRKVVKVDVTTPDDVLVTPDAISANSKGWYTKKELTDQKFSVDVSLENSDVSKINGFVDVYYQGDITKGNIGEKQDGTNGTRDLSTSFEIGYKGAKGLKRINLIEEMGQDGIYTIKTYTKDEAGNVTKTKTYTYKVNLGGLSLKDIYHGSDKLGDFTAPSTISPRKKDAGELTIDVFPGPAKLEKVEYMLCEDLSLVKGATAPEDGTWLTYDDTKKPEISNFKGSIFVRITDESGVTTEYRTSNIMVDAKNPTVKVTPVEDTTKWQENQNFKVELQDGNSGLDGFEIKYAAQGILQSVRIGSNDFTRDADWFKERGIINWKYEPGTGDDISKVYSGKISFTFTDTAASKNRKDGSKLTILGTDGVGNVGTSSDIPYKIDAVKPDAQVEYLANTALWVNEYASFKLKNNVQAEDDTTTGEAHTLSKVTWYYKVGVASSDWIKINDTPTDKEQSFKYTKDINDTIFFKAVSESGLESDVITKLVKVDTKKPEVPSVRVKNQAGLETPDGLNGWYNKKWPTIMIENPTKGAEPSSNETTYYRFYTQGNGALAQPSILGQSILNSRFQKQGTSPEKGIQEDNNNGKDTLEESAGSVSTLQVPTPKAPESYKEPSVIETGDKIQKKEFYVLNIYPTSSKYQDDGNHFRSWMYEISNEANSMPVPDEATATKLYKENEVIDLTYGSGVNKITIHIKGVNANSFNNSPTAYMKYSKDGTTAPDLIYYGAVDAGGKSGGDLGENYNVITNDKNALNLVEQYLQAGNGFLVGHDTSHAQPGLYTLLQSYLRLEPSEGGDATSYGRNGTGLQVVKEGNITSFPFKIGSLGTKFAREDTHTLGGIRAYGDIWIAMTDGTGITTDRAIGVNSVKNYYLTTNNNIGFSQIGHSTIKIGSAAYPTQYAGRYNYSKSIATTPEKQLLVNTITTLSQKPISQFPSSDGTPQPVDAIIVTKEQFEMIGTSDMYPASGRYILQQNITVDTPIENFTGSFDGGTRTITGTAFKNTGKNAKIMNLTITGGSLVSGSNEGQIINCKSMETALALVNINEASGSIQFSSLNNSSSTKLYSDGGIANINKGVIANCKVSSDFNSSTSRQYIGGISGLLDAGTIKNCTFSGSILSIDDDAGGIVGQMKANATLSDCVSSGTLSTQSTSAASSGGVVGSMDGSTSIITTCQSNMSIISTNTTGGIVGTITGGTVLNSKNIGSIQLVGSGLVNVIGHAGGIAGKLDSTGILYNCLNSGSITLSSSAVGSVSIGGIVGNNSGSIDTCQNSGALSITDVDSLASLGGAVGMNAGSIQNSSTVNSNIGTSSRNTMGGFVGVHKSPGIINNASTDQDSFAGMNYLSTSQPVINADGIYQLEVWSEDEAVDVATMKVHNASKKQMYTIKVDTTAPDPVSIEVDKNPFTQFLSNITFNQFFLETTDIKITSEDVTSGVGSLNYVLYNTKGLTGTISNGDGTQDKNVTLNNSSTTFGVTPNYEGYVTSKITDNAGNVRTVSSEGFKINSTLPRVKADAKVGTSDYNGAWTNQNVTVDLTFLNKDGATTLGGDFVNYEYTTDDGTTWKTLNPSSDNNGYFTAGSIAGTADKKLGLTMSKDTVQKFKFRSKIANRSDDAKTSSETVTVMVQIDKNKPTLQSSDPTFNVSKVVADSMNSSTLPSGYADVYGKVPTISFGASDPLIKGYMNGVTNQDIASGLIREEYSLDAALTKKGYTDPIILEDGLYTLNYEVEDRANNITKITQQKFVVDTKKPNAPIVETTIDGSTYTQGAWTDKTVLVSAEFDSTAPKSGNNKIEYIIYKNGIASDGWKTYTNKLNISADGSYDIRFRSTSNAGHISDEATTSINVEASKPSITVNPVGVVSTDGTVNWTNESVSFAISTNGKQLFYKDTDGDYVEYKEDGASVNFKNFVVESEGIYKYQFKAKNKSGVESDETTTYIVGYDITKPDDPTLSFEDQEDKSITDFTKWYTKASVTIKDDTVAKADESPRTLYYNMRKLGEVGTFIKVTSTEVEIGQDKFKNGTWVIDAYTKDAAGNASRTISKTIKISNSIPTITIEKDKVPMQASDGNTLTVEKDGKTLEVYNEPIEVTLKAEDEIGIEKIEYRTKVSEAWKLYTGPLDLGNFEGTVYVKASNHAGTSSEAEYSYVVDNQKPSVEIHERNGKIQSKWYVDDFFLDISGGDESISGFERYEYSVNGSEWLPLTNKRDDAKTDLLDNATYKIDTNGQYNIKVRSLSKNGLYSDPATYKAWLDKENFNLAIEVHASEIADETIWKGGVKFTLSANASPLSGVEYYYSQKVDADGKLENPIKVSGNEVLVNESTAAKGVRYYFMGISGTGKKSAVIDEIAYVDRTAPKAPLMKMENGTLGKNDWYISAPDIHVETIKDSGDTKSYKDVDDVNRTQVTSYYNLQEIGKTNTDSFVQGENVILSDGEFEVVGRAKDNAGNISSLTARTKVKVDTKKPVMQGLQASRTTYSGLTSLWNRITGKEYYNEEITVEVQATDIGSGVDHFKYFTTENGIASSEKAVQADKDGIGCISLSPDFDGTLSVFAVDEAGWKSDVIVSNPMQIEVEKPTIFIDPVSSSEWITTEKAYSVLVKDEKSGIASIQIMQDGVVVFEKNDYVSTNEVKINTASDGTTSLNLVQTPTGLSSISVTVRDHSGNEQTRNETYFVETSAPNLDVTATLPDGSGGTLSYEGKPSAEDVTLQVSLHEIAISGIAKMEVATSSSQTGPFTSWQAVDRNASGVYEVIATKEEKVYYQFKITTVAGNTNVSTPKLVDINKNVPGIASIDIQAKGISVNGAWVNTEQTVILSAPVCTDTGMANDYEYGYSVKNSLGVEVKNGTMQIPTDGITAPKQTFKLSEEGESTIIVYVRKKDLSQSGPRVSAIARYDATNPTDATIQVVKVKENDWKAKVKIQDALSGGQAIVYSIGDSGNLTVQRKNEDPIGYVEIPFDITQYPSGTEIKILSIVDRAGNVADISATPIIKDIPNEDELGIIEADIKVKNEDKVNGWYRKEMTSLEISAKTTSGKLKNEIEKVTFTDENGSKHVYEGSSLGSDLTKFVNEYIFQTNGIFTFEVRAEDTLGNVDVATLSIKRDSIGPAKPSINLYTTKGIEIPTSGNASEVVVVEITPDMRGEDNTTSPLSNWQYSVDGGKTWSEQIKIQDGANSWKYTLNSNIDSDEFVVRIIDEAGNEGTPSDEKSLHMKDITAPIDLAITEANGEVISSAYKNTNPRILKVSAIDPKDGVISSGLSTWMYSLDGGTNWSEELSWDGKTEAGVPQVISIKDDGIHTVIFKVKDAVGNESVLKNAAIVKVDTRAPQQLNITQADGGHLKSVYKDVKEVDLKVWGVDLDNKGQPASGIEFWNYSLDGGTSWLKSNLKWSETDNTITLTEDKSYNIVYKVIDYAGNEARLMDSISVHKTSSIEKPIDPVEKPNKDTNKDASDFGTNTGDYDRTSKWGMLVLTSGFFVVLLIRKKKKDSHA
ncbi:hypothetical protein [Amedibacillus sp. YH-ame10]